MPLELSLDESGRVVQPEGKTLEYKRDLSSPNRVMRTLAAFANSAGGELVVGVGDHRSLVGVNDSDVEENRLANLIMDSISPKLLPNLERRTVGGKVLLIANVYPSSTAPHWVDAEGPEAGVYLRLGSSTVQADPLQISDMKRRSAGISYDSMPNIRAAEKGLDGAAIASVFPDREVETVKRVLGLTAQEQGSEVPRNGGAFLFAVDREAAFYGAYLRCARFRGTKKQDIDDRLELSVPLLEAVERVEDFLKKHAFRGARFEGWYRHDEWSVPLAMLREVVLNALTHADYSMINRSPIRVAFYDDRIEVDNPGALMPGLTVEMMREGASRVRNPLVARVFHEAGLIEARGTGIPGVMAGAAERGLPEPTIAELPGIIRVVVPTHHQSFMAGAPPYPDRFTDGGRAAAPSGRQVEGQVDAQEGQVDAKVVTLLEAGTEARSRAEMLAAIGAGNKYERFARWVQPLLDARWLEMTQPASPRSPTQKYRTTEAGRRVLAAAWRRMGRG
ncbi:MAG: putative DNA binding domain-containing protein [Bifidobacteriaceae bacterium]|jgi:predicted HTH transcriptional regulator|nr:putative DNA binding domain-containing protein [Bifidobacteriaceae bacterium]